MNKDQKTPDSLGILGRVSLVAIALAGIWSLTTGSPTEQAEGNQPDNERTSEVIEAIQYSTSSDSPSFQGANDAEELTY